METRIFSDEVIQVLPGLDGQDLPVHETTRRSAPQREPVEQGEDHEVEGPGQEEELPERERNHEQEDREQEGLQEKDAKSSGQVRKVRDRLPPQLRGGHSRYGVGGD